MPNSHALLHRCKGRSNGSSQAQAWTAIDDLPTRQSNGAASLNQLPHFLAQVSQPSGSP